MTASEYNYHKIMIMNYEKSLKYLQQKATISLLYRNSFLDIESASIMELYASINVS